MGCGASSDAGDSTQKGPNGWADPSGPKQGNPTSGDRKSQTPRVEERKESHQAPEKTRATTQEQSKDQRAPARGTGNETKSSTAPPATQAPPPAPTSAPNAPSLRKPVTTSTAQPPAPPPNPTSAPNAPSLRKPVTTSTAQPPTPPPDPTSAPNAPSLRKPVRTSMAQPPAQPQAPPPAQPQPSAPTTEKARNAAAATKNDTGPQTSEQAARALQGDIDMTCPSPTKIVRIFTSSTFTDTKVERNMLMKNAYPKVKEYCRRIGYEFQVVDMRWGVRDEATADHMGTELCLKELKLCKEVSTGPNFVTFLSQKYGYTPFPRVIEAKELDAILAAVEDEESKQLLLRWYKLDNNAVPPAYILTPISSLIPDFLSPDDEKKKRAKEIWWGESDKMQYALDKTATKVFDKERARKYIMSVTETEILDAMNTENLSKHFIWFKRDIEDLEQQETSKLLSRFLECTGPEETWQKSRYLLKKLKEEHLSKKLSKDRIVTYNVMWNPTSGINPDEDKQHKDYLEILCKDFVTKLTEMIDAGVAERARTDDTLVEECCQHIRFCQSKCEGFQGRHDTLERIKKYVQGSSSDLLVLHGTSGTGKTSIMAMAAKMMKQWTSHPPVLVLRFLGTSPDSSSVMSLMESLTSQIRRIYKMQPLPNIAKTFYVKSLYFKLALANGRPDKPLIVMLDSLDQLDPAYDARKLGWLIQKLAPGTKIIVSTLPEPIYDCFPALKSRIQSESNFVSVPILDNSDVKSILDNWLTMRHRRLTDHQMTTVLEAFKKCPTPLFLKLSFEEAATWTSYVPADKTVLQETVRASIDFLFQKLEKAHGPMLVSRALAYLTTANNGATEAELEDILSCDDDVLNDVYMYWTPPIRRLPPLLLVRLRTDLNQYLVERGADGVRVIYWYHRQFIEAAEARYCSDKHTNRLIHERLADFFNGTWAEGKKKPYTSAKGEKGTEDRHVSLQPLKFGPNKYNMRTLNNLPYHRIKAGQVILLKVECLANPRFLINKLEAAPLYSVLRDFAMAKQAFPNDDLIKEVLQALNLSQKALTTDPKQLVPQLLQRLNESAATKQLLQRCRDYQNPYILPTKCVLERPGGQLVHSISAHKSDIDMMDMSSDGKLVVTVCQYEKELTIWEVEEGQKKREVKGLGQCTKALFCNHNKWLACELEKKLVIQDVDTGVNIMALPTVGGAMNTAFGTLGKGRTFVMQFMKQAFKLTNLLADPKEEKIPPGIHPDKLKFGSMSNPTGSDNYLAVTSDDQLFVTVYDLNARKFRPSFRAFPKIPDKDDPGEFEEYEAEGVVISPDETFLVYTTMMTSEVVFTDFDGNKLRTIPADEDRSYSRIDLTLDGRHLYTLDDNTLYFFDTKTLQEVGKMQQERSITMAITHDAVNVLTVSDDGNLRIWDRSRKELPKDTSNQCTTKLRSFNFVQVLNNPRYVLLCGCVEEDGKTLPNLRLEVYDVFTNTTARWGELANAEGGNISCSEAFNMKNDNQVILVLGRKQIVRVDLQTMKVVKTYVGFTTKIKMSEDTEEIFCTTRGAMHMKLYDKNGDFVTVMKVGQKQRIFDIQMNTTGTVGCALADEGPLILFDITNRKHLYNIDQGPYGDCFAITTLINKAGTRMIFNSDKIDKDPVMKNIDHIVLWDIRGSREDRRMYDRESQRLLQATDSDNDVGLDQIYELEGDRVLSTHLDNVIRIWSMRTGVLMHQLRGHTTSLHISLNEKSPYIFSYGCMEEEDCFRLWDKKTFNCVASFNLDKTVTKIALSADGKFLMSIKTGNPPDVTMWKVLRGHSHMTVIEKDYPQTFSQKGDKTEEPMKVKIYQSKALQMEGDPDSDPEEIDEDDDSENDDDNGVDDDDEDEEDDD